MLSAESRVLRAGAGCGARFGSHRAAARSPERTPLKPRARLTVLNDGDIDRRRARHREHPGRRHVRPLLAGRPAGPRRLYSKPSPAQRSHWPAPCAPPNQQGGPPTPHLVASERDRMRMSRDAGPARRSAPFCPLCADAAEGAGLGAGGDWRACWGARERVVRGRRGNVTV